MIYNYKNLIILLILPLFCACNVTNVSFMTELQEKIHDKVKEVDQSLVYNEFFYVDIESQTLHHIKKGQFIKKYSISSSKYGTGSDSGSLRTPLGIHSIKQKIGNQLPFAAILKGRVWNGDIATIISENQDTDFDYVTSRIMWLEGLELGSNKGKGIDSFSRFIYIHGTAEEGLIGKPASDGCIRMYNADVIELFEISRSGMKVLIY